MGGEPLPAYTDYVEAQQETTLTMVSHGSVEREVEIPFPSSVVFIPFKFLLLLYWLALFLGQMEWP